MKILLFIFMLTCFADCRQGGPEPVIREAVERQMGVYPRSSLRDLYKNFFQDRFGPGHLLTDTAAAGRYLRSELESRSTWQGPIFEPTGYQGNFYRVNLSVVATGVIPYGLYFDAFVRSVDGIVPLPVEEWIGEWQMIESVIGCMDLQLPGYEQDKQEIEALLQSGKYAMHHSRDFAEAYDPHYRIIEKTIFENELLPLINRKTGNNETAD